MSTTRMVAVKARGGGGAVEAETAVVDKSKLIKKFQVSRAILLHSVLLFETVVSILRYIRPMPFPLPSASLLSRICSRVTEQISLDPLTNKIGDVWHVFLRGDFKDILYGYIFGGEFSPDKGQYYDSSKILFDPYAKAVISRGEFGALRPEDNCWLQMTCVVPTSQDQILNLFYT
ncbi:hypothetical protein REPUB_Repub03eG0146500 [Reevesia pubescens]